MKYLNVILILVVSLSSFALADQPQALLVCAEDITTTSVNPSDPEVNALTIYISFPDVDPSFHSIPTYASAMETTIEDYYASQSNNQHIVNVQTAYRPEPDNNLCYMTDYDSDYYANLIYPLNRDGLAVLTDEIFWKVYNDDNNAFDDIDVVFMNYNCYGGDLFWFGNSAWATLGYYTFPYYNKSGITNTFWNDQEILEWTVAHEYGHLLGSGHHNEGIYCIMDGTSWDSSVGIRPYCSFLLRHYGWIEDTKFDTITSNMYNLTISPVNLEQGIIYKFVYESQAFYIENHQGINYDNAYPGTGLLIWHGSTNNENHYGKDLENADGKWNWEKTSCQEHNDVYVFPFVQTTEDPIYGKDETDLRYVNVCYDGQYVEGTYSHPDMKGDSEDFFQIGGNTMFADWTNPNSRNDPNNITDLSVEIVDQNGVDLVVNFYTNYWAGTISVNTTWSDQIYVADNVTVESGVTLTIEPGSTIKFSNGAGLFVNGALIADGGPQDIVFSSSQASPSPGDWVGINFYPGASENSIIEDCVIEYASYAIAINDVDVTISSNTIQNSSTIGIYSYGASPTITQNTLTNTGEYGIYLTYSNEPYLQYNSISNNSIAGIYLYQDHYGTNPTQILDNTISNTGTYGIRNRWSDPFIARNTITGCTKGVYCYSSPYADFRYNNIYYNTYGVYVASGNPTFNRGPLNDRGGANNVVDNSSYGFKILGSANPQLGVVIFLPPKIKDYTYVGFNDIFGNNGSGAEIYTSSSRTIFAHRNYWGTASPTGADVYSGSGTVDYSFYLTQPWGGIPTGASAPENGNTSEPALLLASAIEDEGNKDYVSAGQKYRDLVTRHPASPHAHLALEQYVRVLQRLGKFGNQRTFFKQMSSNPRHPLNQSARLFWIDASLDAGAYLPVIRYYTTQAKKNRGTEIEEEAYFHLGMIYLDYLSDLSSAEEQYHQMAARFPNSDLLTEFNLCLTEFDSQLLPMAAKGMVQDDSQESNQLIPSEFALNANYPNPFNPVTTIEYQLPEESMVVLKVYDIMGREIKTLITGKENAGFKNIIWNGRDHNNKPVASGMYIYTISAISNESGKEYRQSRKMVLLK